MLGANIALMLAYALVADGFCISSPLRAVLARGSIAQYQMSTKKDQGAMPLQHVMRCKSRRAMIFSGVAGLSVLRMPQADAHCLTQACLIQLDDPLSSPAAEDLPTRGSSKLPESAYVRLKNGQTVCRLQLGE